jgi:para-aminobenzoate synthetase component I
MIYASGSQTAALPRAGHRRLRWRREGTVLLEDWPGFEGRSLLARRPEAVLRGNLFQDTGELRAVMRRGSVGQSLAGGGLFGWVGFDGAFCFGVFPGCEWVDQGSMRRGVSREVGLSEASLSFVPQMTRAQFEDRVRRAQKYIAAGDVYQVNLSYPWRAAWPEDMDPWAFHERLRAASPAPYAAFLDLEDTQVFSASPECFLRLRGKQVLTRPIKGTRPRSPDQARDATLRAELLGSAKERAELVMITDLERNDLGKVCEFGSVRVTELLALESFAQVHHLVSTVEGTLRESTDHLDAFLACFPGGSISGAPKKRALEIIRELEPHHRGIYTGAMGYFGFNGESQFSVAIRTAWRQGGTVQFHTGAGIVADSDPGLEYEETRHKAAGLLQAACGVEPRIRA